MAPCRHRNDGRGVCIDCGDFLDDDNKAPASFTGADAPDDSSDDACCHPKGHSWVYTGTAYGGDDESYFGEGRCYCEFCGADGDA